MAAHWVPYAGSGKREAGSDANAVFASRVPLPASRFPLEESDHFSRRQLPDPLSRWLLR
jgi:hypothetical protein